MENTGAIVTKHAKNRIRRRVGIPKRAISRHAEMALGHGKTYSEVKGSIGEYAKRLYSRYGTANNIRVYQGNIYLFRENVLITVVNIPKSILHQKRRKRDEL